MHSLLTTRALFLGNGEDRESRPEEKEQETEEAEGWSGDGPQQLLYREGSVATFPGFAHMAAGRCSSY